MPPLINALSSAANNTSDEDAAPVIPDYLRAADLHNLGNSGKSALERTGDWFSDVGESLSNTPQFLSVSLLSAANSFYNSGLAVGRVAGLTQQEDRETGAWISEIDSNLGLYYNQDPGAADIAGFFIGSLIPGVVGVKALNMGQRVLAGTKSGFVGTNMGAALGLRTPMIDTYIATAATDIAKGQALYSNLGNAGVKALATGVYQNVLEGVAFETMVQATMFKSPVLDQQSAKDIVWNVATGGLLNGVIGGAFHAASTIGKINAKVADAVADIRQFGSRETIVKNDEIGLRVSAMAKDLELKGAEIASLPANAEKYAEKVQAYEAMRTRVLNDMRKATHAMTKGNQVELGNMLANLHVNDRADNVLARMFGAEEFTHVYGRTAIDNEIDAAIKAGQGVPTALQTNFIKLTGEDAGLVLDSVPAVVNIADTVAQSAGGNIRSKVMDYVVKQKHRIDDMWDGSNVSLLASQGHIGAEARWIAAWNKNITKEIKPGSQIHRYDLPFLTRALNDGVLDIKVYGSSGNIIKDGFTSLQQMQQFVNAMQDTVAAKLFEKFSKKGSELEFGKSPEEAIDWAFQKISKITNISVKALEEGSNGAADYRMYQHAQETYAKFLESKGLKVLESQEADPRFLPTWAKVSRRMPNTKDADGNVLDAMAYFAAQQKITQQYVDNIVAKEYGELAFQLPEVTQYHLADANVRGTGAGLFSFSNPTQGSLGSAMTMLGSVVQRALIGKKQAFAEASEGLLSSLGKKQESVIEWGSLSQKVSRSPHTWHVTSEEMGVRGILSKPALSAYRSAMKSVEEGGDEVDIVDIIKSLERNGEVHYIPVRNDEAWNLAQAHVMQTNKHQNTNNLISAARGKTLGFSTDTANPVFIPIRTDPRDAKHFVMVSDPKVTGQGHKSMIFAQTPERLEELVRKAKEARPDLSFYTASETKEFMEAQQLYQYERTLSENYLDSSLKKAGVYSDYYLKTDPQAVVDDYLAFHTRRIDSQVRELAREKYQPQFDWLEDQARNYGRFDTSKIGGSVRQLEATAKNPYLSYIKTGLNLSRANENPLWFSVNKAADSAVSNAVSRVGELWNGVKGSNWTPEAQAASQETNRLLQHYGLNTGYVDAATQLIVNEKIPQGELSKFVSGANSLLARLVLGLDPLNAMTNAVGANILRMTELKSLLRSAKAGNSKLAGKLAQLIEVDITGQGDFIWSATKLNARGYDAYFKSLFGDGKDIKFFRDIGVIRDISDQFKAAIDNLTLRGSEVTQDLNPRLAKAKEIIDNISRKGEKWTGNAQAEEMNRFVTAWGMKQLTDPLVANGRMTAKEQISYINTHVNRVEGNMIASQRPFVFQGPIGQAIGLFQSYQFNLMQQMFRYVAEGSKKDAAMLLGLQGTFFGIQGLPAFQAINQHIVGTASGNPTHQDLYSATYGVAGKNLGDLLLYGIPSNLLQTNMYSRGDINPRQITIIPTALSEVPLVSAMTKTYTGIKNAVSRIGAGANVWESVLQGIEHTSVNRPLAGMAQIAQATTGNGDVMSTTSKGSILFTNDLVSIASASRLVGGRPLDEAIVNDMVFRIHAYKALDQQKMKNLSAAVRTSNINGQEMDESDIARFAEVYAKNGGRLVNFNQFMVHSIKSAKTSEAERIVQKLKDPYSQRMQDLMGGGASQLPSTEFDSGE